MPKYNVASWNALAAPAGTPPEIVNKLHDAFKAVMAMPEVAKQLANIGMIPVISPSPEELRTFISTAVTRWGKIVQQAGIAGRH